MSLRSGPVQSARDSNLNGDSAGDRVVLNPAGTNGVGSGVTPLCNSAMPAFGVCGESDFDPTVGPPGPGNFDSSPFLVAYQANNPNARYIVAGAGALATGGRNTLPTEPTNDISLSVYKDVNITERMKFRIGAQFANVINHPQFIPGSNPGQGLGVNDVASFTTTTSNYLNYVTPSNANFNNPRSVFASNARTIALVAKFTF